MRFVLDRSKRPPAPPSLLVIFLGKSRHEGALEIALMDEKRTRVATGGDLVSDLVSFRFVNGETGTEQTFLRHMTVWTVLRSEGF